jgi:DNA excision repair protein ERCC-8
MNKIHKRSQDLSKAIFNREVGAVTPLNFCQRQAARRARNLYLSRLRTIGISKEAEDAPDASNRNLLVHRSAITAIDIDSQEWRYVLAGTSDGSLYIHDIVNFSGIPRHNANLITTIKGSDGSRDNNQRNNVQYIGRQQSGRRSSSSRLPHKKPGGHFKMVTTVQWFPEDSGMFITSGMDGAVKMWDANVLESGPVEEFHFPHEQIFSHHLRVTETNSSSNKSALTLLAVASESNHINLLDLKSGSSSHELR